MLETDATTDKRDAVLGSARALAPELSDRASEGETLRTMPADLVARVRTAGLFRLALPRSLGGLELDPLTIVEITELLSEADGSGGWTVLIGNSTAFFAWLEPEVAADMIGDERDFCSTSMFGPIGQAHPDGDEAFSVTGRWPFNSGCVHSEWLQVGVSGHGRSGSPNARRRQSRLAIRVRPPRGCGDRGHLGRARTARDGQPPPLPRAGAGPGRALRGPDLRPGPPRRSALAPRALRLGRVFMAGFPLGVARRAVDEFTTLARTKFRGSPANTVAGNDHAQMLLSQAESRLRAARLYVYETVGSVWEACLAGDRPAPPLRAELALAVCHAMRAALDAVDSLYLLAGAEAVFRGHPLERCFRDLHTGSQHIMFSSAREQEFARIQLGVDPATD